MFKLVLEKAEEVETKLPISAGSLKKQEISKKNLFCFIDYAKAYCVDHNKLWKILQEMGIPEHLTCLMRNLYAGQEAAVRTGRGLVPNQERSMSRLYIVTLLILVICRVHHEKHWADEAQAGIKIARRNINNLRYADETTLTIESEEELKSLLMELKESEKVGLKLYIQKTKSLHPVTSPHGK